MLKSHSVLLAGMGDSEMAFRMPGNTGGLKDRGASDAVCAETCDQRPPKQVLKGLFHQVTQLLVSQTWRGRYSECPFLKTLTTTGFLIL